MPGLLNFATQSVAHGLAPWHQLGVWEKQICGLHPDLLNQNLHIDKKLKCLVDISQFEKRSSRVFSI